MDAFWRKKRHLASVERRRLHRKDVLDGRRTKSEFVPSRPNEVWVRAPALFELQVVEAHERLVRFLYELRSAFTLSGTVCIDFRGTTRMIAGGTLLFYAELSRLLLIFPTKPIRCIPSRDLVVNEVLQHLGIFSLLGYRHAVIPTRNDVVTWNTASGTEVDGEEVGRLIESYDSVSPAVGLVFRGVAEAMLNSIQHGYLADRKDGLATPPEHRWWLFCRIIEDTFFVAFCDLGIGIPRSLPKKYTSEMIAEARSLVSGGRKASDALMIQAAMEIARTRTEKLGRGKGLADLRKVVDRVEGAELFLFSNRGLVRYKDHAYRRLTYRKSILGTLVVWTIPLSGDENG